MISRCLLFFLVAIGILVAFLLVGALINQHPRVFLGIGVCALAAICYVELDHELGAAAKRGY
jgi:hypothetical protein